MGSPSDGEKYADDEAALARERALESSEPPLERAEESYFQWRDAHVWLLRLLALAVAIGGIIKLVVTLAKK